MLLKLGIKKIKIPSGEINNRTLLSLAGKQKMPIILSTGMSNINEIKDALNVLIKSGTKKNNITFTTKTDFLKLNSINGVKHKSKKSVLF